MFLRLGKTETWSTQRANERLGTISSNVNGVANGLDEQSSMAVAPSKVQQWQQQQPWSELCLHLQDPMKVAEEAATGVEDVSSSKEHLVNTLAQVSSSECISLLGWDALLALLQCVTHWLVPAAGCCELASDGPILLGQAGLSISMHCNVMIALSALPANVSLQYQLVVVLFARQSAHPSVFRESCSNCSDCALLCDKHTATASVDFQSLDRGLHYHRVVDRTGFVLVISILHFSKFQSPCVVSIPCRRLWRMARYNEYYDTSPPFQHPTMIPC